MVNRSTEWLFCLSLFIHPCASSPDQRRQEEAHAHWGHLSLLFTGLTKAACFFQDAGDLLFTSPRAYAHLPHTRPWKLETVRVRLRKRPLYWLISSAWCHVQVWTALSNRFQTRNKAVTWKTGWNCFNTTFFSVCFGLEMLTGQTTLMHNATARVWESLVVWWRCFAMLTKYEVKNWIKTHRLCGTLFFHRQQI